MIIAFTGHRPSNEHMIEYDFYSNKNTVIRLELYSTIIKNTIKSENNPPFGFIVGGALGIDQIAADCILDMKDRFNCDITLEIAVPCCDQPIKWRTTDIERYFKQLQSADKVTYVDYLEGYSIPKNKVDKYHPSKMIMRNKYMVDKCDLLIAVWDGSEKGGTYDCIKYALKQGKKIIYINPREVVSKWMKKS